MGGIALSIIGEVQADARFPEKPGNLVLDDASNRQALQSLAHGASVNEAHLWAQLGHAGALSHPPISRPKGPSALNVGDLQCAGMTMDEVRDLPGIFASAARRAKAAGFGGVQIHAGHGFLLSQFLSPLFNHRTDRYGGSIEARCQIVLDILAEVRNAVGSGFPVAIKINATDNLQGGLTHDDALKAVGLLDRTSVDLIDISGGTYFPGAKAASDGAGSGPYFLDFARLARSETSKPLMLTGGIKTREQAADVVASGAADAVSLARAMVLDPQLADTWQADIGGDPEFPKFKPGPPGAITSWYTMRLTALAEDREDDFDLDLAGAMQAYEDRDAMRCKAWLEKFAP